MVSVTETGRGVDMDNTERSSEGEGKGQLPDQGQGEEDPGKGSRSDEGEEGEGEGEGEGIVLEDICSGSEAEALLMGDEDAESEDSLKILEALEEYKCPICMEILIKASLVCCGHRFCLYCISEWFHHSSPRRFCPVCRKNSIFCEDDVETDEKVEHLYACLPLHHQQQRHDVLLDRDFLSNNLPHVSSHSPSPSSSSLPHPLPRPHQHQHQQSNLNLENLENLRNLENLENLENFQNNLYFDGFVDELTQSWATQYSTEFNSNPFEFEPVMAPIIGDRETFEAYYPPFQIQTFPALYNPPPFPPSSYAIHRPNSAPNPNSTHIYSNIQNLDNLTTEEHLHYENRCGSSAYIDMNLNSSASTDPTNSIYNRDAYFSAEEAEGLEGDERNPILPFSGSGSGYLRDRDRNQDRNRDRDQIQGQGQTPESHRQVPTNYLSHLQNSHFSPRENQNQNHSSNSIRRNSGNPSGNNGSQSFTTYHSPNSPINFQYSYEDPIPVVSYTRYGTETGTETGTGTGTDSPSLAAPTNHSSQTRSSYVDAGFQRQHLTFPLALNTHSQSQYADASLENGFSANCRRNSNSNNSAGFQMDRNTKAKSRGRRPSLNTNSMYNNFPPHDCESERERGTGARGDMDMDMQCRQGVGWTENPPPGPVSVTYHATQKSQWEDEDEELEWDTDLDLNLNFSSWSPQPNFPPASSRLNLTQASDISLFSNSRRLKAGTGKSTGSPMRMTTSQEDYQQDVLIQQEFQRLDQMLLRDNDEDHFSSLTSSSGSGSGSGSGVNLDLELDLDLDLDLHMHRDQGIDQVSVESVVSSEQQYDNENESESPSCSWEWLREEATQEVNDPRYRFSARGHIQNQNSILTPENNYSALNPHYSLQKHGLAAAAPTRGGAGSTETEYCKNCSAHAQCSKLHSRSFSPLNYLETDPNFDLDLDLQMKTRRGKEKEDGLKKWGPQVDRNKVGIGIRPLLLTPTTPTTTATESSSTYGSGWTAAAAVSPARTPMSAHVLSRKSMGGNLKKIPFRPKTAGTMATATALVSIPAPRPLLRIPIPAPAPAPAPMPIQLPRIRMEQNLKVANRNMTASGCLQGQGQGQSSIAQRCSNLRRNPLTVPSNNLPVPPAPPPPFSFLAQVSQGGGGTGMTGGGAGGVNLNMMGISQGDGVWGVRPEMDAKMYLPLGLLHFKMEYQPTTASAATTTTTTTTTSTSALNRNFLGSSTEQQQQQSQTNGRLSLTQQQQQQQQQQQLSQLFHLAKFTHPIIHMLPLAPDGSTRLNLTFDLLYQT